MSAARGVRVEMLGVAVLRVSVVNVYESMSAIQVGVTMRRGVVQMYAVAVRLGENSLARSS